LKKRITKRKQGVVAWAQGVDPEFKPQYCKTQNKTKKQHNNASKT
jgi:hypothetical protein